MRVFSIRDESLDSGKDLGFLLYYEREREFNIELPEDADIWETPLLLSSFVKKGQLTVPDVWARIWVEQRIVPRDRQNLGAILRENGLSDYDVFALLELSDGRCAQDDCYLTEIRADELPLEIRERLRKGVADVVPLADQRVMVFFRDDTTRCIDIGKLYAKDRHFRPVLKDDMLFDMVTVSPGGHDIRWSREIAVSAKELYNKGEAMPLKMADFAGFAGSHTLTTAEVCEYLGCTRQNVDDLVRRGKLKPVKTAGKTKLFLKSDIMERLW